MAQRDKTQGFGFMYVDITKLLNQKKELEKKEGAPFEIPQADIKTLQFSKEPTQKVSSLPSALAVAAPLPFSQQNDKAQENAKDKEIAVNQIKDNLDRLQSLHHKLHAMLDELNKITDNSRKRKIE